MCRYLKLKEIYQITGKPKYSINHEGKPYVNADFQPGQLLALGWDKEWYRSTLGFTDIADAIPPKKTGEFERVIFRDHWMVIGDENKGIELDAPYYNYIRAAPKKRLF